MSTANEPPRGETIGRDISGARIILTAAALVVVVAGLRASSPLVVPLLVAVFIAVVITPALDWLKARRVPTAIALLLLAVALTLVLMGVLTIVGRSVNDFVSRGDINQAQIHAETQRIIAWLKEKGIDLPEDELLKYFNPRSVIGVMTGVLSGLTGLFSNAFLILLTVMFILLEAAGFPHKLARAARGRETSLRRGQEIVGKIRNYMALKSATSLATGVLVALWLTWLGVDYALMWGLVAFLMNFIPNIGSILAAVPAVLLALIELGVGGALWTAAGYLAINTVIGSFLEPRIMGRGLGLSPLVVFISLIFWGWVLGPIGMLLSVPLTMVVKIALETADDTRWLAVLMGSDETGAA